MENLTYKTNPLKHTATSHVVEHKAWDILLCMMKIRHLRKATLKSWYMRQEVASS